MPHYVNDGQIVAESNNLRTIVCIYDKKTGD